MARFQLLLVFLILKMSASDPSFDMALEQHLFTKELYKVLGKDPSKNIFFSPFSILSAMSMVQLGAGGNTELQGQTVLHYPQNKEDLKQGMKQLLEGLKTENKSYELETSNSVYVSDQLEVLKAYMDDLKTFYQADSKVVNFGTPEVVRKEINAKVEEATRSKIKDLIAPGSLTPLTRMVLVNAIYFKGAWQQTFDKAKTSDEKFWVNPSHEMNVPMMSINARFRYTERDDLDSCVLAMDYEGDRMTMMLVLPNEKNGLAKLEGKLDTIDFVSLEKSLKHLKVNVKIPKFKLEDSLDLVRPFQEMGMTDLFNDGSADLSGISEKGDLYVSNIFHKSFIEVNEEGSEAAAATGVIMMTRALLKPPPAFVADHPFLFFIMDSVTNQILFVGRFRRPAESV